MFIIPVFKVGYFNGIHRIPNGPEELKCFLSLSWLSLMVRKFSFFCILPGFPGLTLPHDPKAARQKAWEVAQRVTSACGTSQTSTIYPSRPRRKVHRSSKDKPGPGHVPRNAQGKKMPVWFSSLLLARSRRWHTLPEASPPLRVRALRGQARSTGFHRGLPGAAPAPSRARGGVPLTTGNQNTSALTSSA